MLKFKLFLRVSNLFLYYFFTLLEVCLRIVDLSFSFVDTSFSFLPFFPSYFALSFVSCFSQAPSYPPALYSLQFRLIPRTKKAPATILIYFRCTLLLRSRISLRFSVSRPDDNSRANDDDKLQLDALMRRKCPPAGKSPGVESCRALIPVPSSFANLRH